jgi:hypothetical protein
LAFDIFYDYEKVFQDSYKLFNEAEKITDKIHALWARLKAIQLREKYLENVGALDQIRIDFEYKSYYHREKKEEEKYPYKKGERDRHIKQTALYMQMLIQQKRAR